MSFTTDFVKKYDGKVVCFPEGSFCGECLSLVKIYIQERYGIYPPASGCNGARCYWSLFPDPLGTVLRLVSNTVDVIPKEGWIAVWNATQSNEYGHIGIVLDATQTGFTSFDSNWGGRFAHKVTHDYNNVAGFLAPKESDMADKIYTEEEMTKVRLERDRNWDSYQKEIQAHKKTSVELSETKGGLDELNKELKAKQVIIAELNTELENCSESAVDPGLWDINGKSVEITEGNTKTITNYKRIG